MPGGEVTIIPSGPFPYLFMGSSGTLLDTRTYHTTFPGALQYVRPGNVYSHYLAEPAHCSLTNSPDITRLEQTRSSGVWRRHCAHTCAHAAPPLTYPRRTCLDIRRHRAAAACPRTHRSPYHLGHCHCLPVARFPRFACTCYSSIAIYTWDYRTLRWWLYDLSCDWARPTVSASSSQNSMRDRVDPIAALSSICKPTRGKEPLRDHSGRPATSSLHGFCMPVGGGMKEKDVTIKHGI